jgi:tripartite-type tricarboxylate transporter receptor subunit TctC
VSRALAALIIVACQALAGTAAFAQAWPAKPLRLVIPFPPGGSADILGRLVAKQLGDQLGQAVVAENRPGAGTMIGADAVAKSTPDGYTLLLGTVSSNAMAPAIAVKAPYDPAKDFTPISALATVPFVLVAHPSVNASSAPELLTLLRARPGGLTYASAGNGTSNHFAAELYKQQTRTFVVHIPYRGSAPALQDVMGGQVQLMFDLASTALPALRSGKVRALAVTGGTRLASLPDVPTLKETGLKDFEVSAWFALFAPSGLPSPVAQRLHAETVKMFAQSEFQERLRALEMQAMRMSQNEFADFVGREVTRWKEVARSANIKPD